MKKFEDELDKDLEEEIDSEKNNEDNNEVSSRKNKLEKELLDEEESGNAVLKEIFSWIKIFVGAFIVAYLLTTFVIVNATIPTGSMKNTINEDDKVIGFRLAYLFGEPEHGEIVMFWAPDKEETIYIKRVIGVPGDTIKVENNTVYVNGKAQDEPYIKEWTNSPGTEEWILGEDEYFMMGDNRNYSNDSRVYGVIKGDKIIAKALFRYSPSLKSLS